MPYMLIQTVIHLNKYIWIRRINRKLWWEIRNKLFCWFRMAMIDIDSFCGILRTINCMSNMLRLRKWVWVSSCFILKRQILFVLFFTWRIIPKNYTIISQLMMRMSSKLKINNIKSSIIKSIMFNIKRRSSYKKFPVSKRLWKTARKIRNMKKTVKAVIVEINQIHNSMHNQKNTKTKINSNIRNKSKPNMSILIKMKKRSSTNISKNNNEK